MGLIYDKITAVLRGEIEPEELGPSWAADIAMPIYLEASRILGMHFSHRAEVIDEKPERIKQILKDEIIRIHSMRRGIAPKAVEKSQPSGVSSEPGQKPKWHGWKK